MVEWGAVVEWGWWRSLCAPSCHWAPTCWGSGHVANGAWGWRFSRLPFFLMHCDVAPVVQRGSEG